MNEGLCEGEKISLFLFNWRKSGDIYCCSVQHLAPLEMMLIAITRLLSVFNSLTLFAMTVNIYYASHLSPAGRQESWLIRTVWTSKERERERERKRGRGESGGNAFSWKMIDMYFKYVLPIDSFNAIMSTVACTINRRLLMHLQWTRETIERLSSSIKVTSLSTSLSLSLLARKGKKVWLKHSSIRNMLVHAS